MVGMKRYSKLLIATLLALCVTYYIASKSGTLYIASELITPAAVPYAKYISPQELMSRPLSPNLEAIPKLIHQSWSSNKLPRKFEDWSHSCRRQHSDWEWVLWTDEDNLLLVKTYFPWLLSAYANFAGVVYQADLVRNMYMYIYGGLYADLDVECLRSSDELFETYNVSTVPHLHASTPWTNSDLSSGRKAFFGRMGTDNSFEHSIPNAWMASTPGHPFFLLVLESVNKIITEGGQDQGPESVTGPVVLLNTINEYHNVQYSGNEFDELISTGHSGNLYRPQQWMKHAVELLPFQYIYPYSWERDGDAYRSVCWATIPTFDPARCKQLLGTDHWPSYAITYWSHTWTGASHDEENLHSLE